MSFPLSYKRKNELMQPLYIQQNSRPCIQNLIWNKILIACKFTVCEFENSQSETNNSIYWTWKRGSRAFCANWMRRTSTNHQSSSLYCGLPSEAVAAALPKTKEVLPTLASRFDNKFIVTNSRLWERERKRVSAVSEEEYKSKLYYSFRYMIIQECASVNYSSVRLAGS